MKTSITPTQLRSVRYNRVAYIVLLFVAIIFLLLRDWQNGFCLLGISLIADPFDYRVTWARRPLWQRIWLMVHVIIVYVLLFYLLISKL